MATENDESVVSMLPSAGGDSLMKETDGGDIWIPALPLRPQLWQIYSDKICHLLRGSYQLSSQVVDSRKVNIPAAKPA